MDNKQTLNKILLVNKMMRDRSKDYITLLDLNKGSHKDRHANFKTYENVMESLDIALDGCYTTANIQSVFPWYDENAETVIVTDAMIDRLLYILIEWNKYVKCKEFTNSKQRSQFYDYKETAIRVLYKNGTRILSEDLHERLDGPNGIEYFVSYTVQGPDNTVLTFHQPWEQVSKFYADTRHYYGMVKYVKPYEHSDAEDAVFTGSSEERSKFKRMLGELYILSGVIRKNLPQTYKQYAYCEREAHYELPFSRFIKHLPAEESTLENYEQFNKKLNGKLSLPGSIKL